MSVERHALQRFLDRLLSRSELSREEQAAILGLDCRLSQVPPRIDIVSHGETVGHACLIARGLAARFDQMRNGKRQIVAFHIPGDMGDLHSVVAPTAAWGIAALTATSVVHIPLGALRHLVETYPAIALAFWRDSTADASILAKSVGNLGRQEARARIAHVLCELGIRMEQAGLGTRTLFDFHATQEQLADAVGLTAVHVNRTLQRIRAAGLIATHGHTVEIQDWQGLVDLAEFDPAFLLPGKPVDAKAP